MGIINVLEPQVANLIAAGEVVDRPASVIKELLENAIDSGADAVTVEIRHGGISLIRVSDNGCGMSREDVPVCIKRHATSKIHSERDLDSIVTLGFRGEALAAIGAVSTLRIITKQKNSSMGTALTCVGGEIREITETGAQNGTTVIVEELFANIPARRKFLKKDTSEALACAAVVEKIALSRPDISLKFISDGNLKFSTSGDKKLINAIYAVLGRDFAHKLTAVHGKTGGIEVTGYIGTPENVRANRNYQNFFINGRYIKSRTAMAALEQAYSSYIPSDKFPVCVLELRIHPALVDVNVHPAKLEVKFSNEQAVFDAVYSAVLTSLENSTVRPEFKLGSDKNKKDSKIIGAFIPLKETRGAVSDGKGEQMTIKDFNQRSQAVSNLHLYNAQTEELPPHLRFSSGKEKQDNVPLPFSVDNSLVDEITSSGGEQLKADVFVKKVDIIPSDQAKTSPAVRNPGENKGTETEKSNFHSGAGITYGNNSRNTDANSAESAIFSDNSVDQSISGNHSVKSESQIQNESFPVKPEAQNNTGKSDNPDYVWDNSEISKKTGYLSGNNGKSEIFGVKPEINVSNSEKSDYKSVFENSDHKVITALTDSKDKFYKADISVPDEFPEMGESEQPETAEKFGFKSSGVPEYRILGEIFSSYVLVETEEKLLMIDKHAAHERILFEDMRRNISGQAESQMLLVPLSVSLTGEETAALEEYGEKISAMGFMFEATEDKGKCNVTAIPSGLSGAEAETLFVTVLGKLADGTGNAEITGKLFFEQALYQASCKAAIKAGRIYDESHLKWICDRLLSDEKIRFCPHGRPVAFEITQSEIEHWFKRK